MATHILARLHHNVKDIRDQRFGRWTALRYLGGRRWLCRCDCGTERPVFGRNLRSDGSQSCGCLLSSYNTATKTIHGMSAESEYRTWSSIKQRCRNPKAPNYHRYGGAGVTMCDRWFDSFDAFFADMGPKPSRLHSIDRIDGTGGYEPANCRWATGTQQHRNKRSNRLIAHLGKTQTLAEWSDEVGIGATTIALRLNRGWPAAKALSVRPWTAGVERTERNANSASGSDGAQV